MNNNKNGDMQSRGMDAFQRSQVALKLAKKRMKDEGHTYPLYDHVKSPQENYDLVAAYAAKETAYMQEFLRNPNPRPVEEFPAREDWIQRSYDK